MEEKIILSVDVLEHLNNIKNLNIKYYLKFLDTVDMDENTKMELREYFLDLFNGYHRETSRVFKKCLTD